MIFKYAILVLLTIKSFVVALVKGGVSSGEISVATDVAGFRVSYFVSLLLGSNYTLFSRYLR